MNPNSSIKMQLLVSFALFSVLVSGLMARPMSKSSESDSPNMLTLINDDDIKQEETTLYKELCLNLVSVPQWNLMREPLKKFCLTLLIGKDIQQQAQQQSSEESSSSSSSEQFIRPRRFLEIGIGKSNDLTTNSNKGFKYGK